MRLCAFGVGHALRTVMFGLDIIITFNLGYYNSEGWPINSRCDPPPLIHSHPCPPLPGHRLPHSRPSLTRFHVPSVKRVPLPSSTAHVFSCPYCRPRGYVTNTLPRCSRARTAAPSLSLAACCTFYCVVRREQERNRAALPQVRTPPRSHAFFALLSPPSFALEQNRHDCVYFVRLQHVVLTPAALAPACNHGRTFLIPDLISLPPYGECGRNTRSLLPWTGVHVGQCVSRTVSPCVCL
jgi:hypothetical protein